MIHIENYKIAFNDHLSKFGQALHKSKFGKVVHEQAANVSEETIHRLEGAIGALASISLIKDAKDLVKGESSYTQACTNVAILFIMKTTVEYIKSTKNYETNALKNRVKMCIIAEVKNLRPEWTCKSDADILQFVKKARNSPVQNEQPVDHLTAQIQGFKFSPKVQTAFTNTLVKHYLKHTNLIPETATKA